MDVASTSPKFSSMPDYNEFIESSFSGSSPRKESFQPGVLQKISRARQESLADKGHQKSNHSGNGPTLRLIKNASENPADMAILSSSISETRLMKGFSQELHTAGQSHFAAKHALRRSEKKIPSSAILTFNDFLLKHVKLEQEIETYYKQVTSNPVKEKTKNDFFEKSILEKINKNTQLLNNLKTALSGLKNLSQSGEQNDSSDSSCILGKLTSRIQEIAQQKNLRGLVGKIERTKDAEVKKRLIESIGKENWHHLKQWEDHTRFTIGAILQEKQMKDKGYSKLNLGISLGKNIEALTEECHPQLLAYLEREAKNFKPLMIFDPIPEQAQVYFKRKIKQYWDDRGHLAPEQVHKEFLNSLNGFYEECQPTDLGLTQSVSARLEGVLNLCIRFIQEQKIAGSDCLVRQLNERIVKKDDFAKFIHLLDNWGDDSVNKLIFNFLGTALDDLKDWQMRIQQSWSGHLKELSLMEGQVRLLPHYYSHITIEDENQPKPLEKQPVEDVKRLLTNSHNFHSLTVEHLKSMDDREGKLIETIDLNRTFTNQTAFFCELFSGLKEGGWIFPPSTQEEDEIMNQALHMAVNLSDKLEVMHLLRGLTNRAFHSALFDAKQEHYQPELYDHVRYWTEISPKTAMDKAKVECVIQIHSPDYFRIIRKWTYQHCLVNPKDFPQFHSLKPSEYGNGVVFAKAEKSYVLTWNSLNDHNQPAGWVGKLYLNSLRIEPETPLPVEQEVLKIYSKEVFASFASDPLIKQFFGEVHASNMN